MVWCSLIGIVPFIIFLPNNRYDFFVVSQSVRQGTVTPTHFNVICDNSGLKPDHIQRMTYKMCHLYYNWPVSGGGGYFSPCLSKIWLYMWWKWGIMNSWIVWNLFVVVLPLIRDNWSHCVLFLEVPLCCEVSHSLNLTPWQNLTPWAPCLYLSPAHCFHLLAGNCACPCSMPVCP